MAYILVVDDEKKMRHLLSIILEREGHKVDQAGDGIEALDMIKNNPYDMVISDIKMPALDGTGLLKEIKKLNIVCPVVFITAFATVDSAVEAMRQGAVDYITKPFETGRILMTVERTLNLSRIMAENVELKKELSKTFGKDTIVYVSKEMEKLMELAQRVAKSDSAVMITGESGTGKELLARFIHHTSPRADKRFVPVNCAAISPHLAESELFGHEKGAFTGADRKKIGKFEFAAGGTIFLDEIGDLPIEAQAKFLRALQEKKIQRVGGNKEIDVDVRVLCATNRNLEKLVEKGEFRQDLFFRINVFPLECPPLRKRKDDIVPLAEYFLKRDFNINAELTDGAVRILMEYEWPGNVRELANAMERAVILSEDQSVITAEILSFLRSLPETCNEPDGDKLVNLTSEGISLEELEKDLVRQALDLTDGNQSAAANLLGLTRSKFRVLLKHAQK